MKWEHERDTLEHLINNEHISYEEIGRKYGVTGGAIRQVAKRLGIELPKRRVINIHEHFNKGTAKTSTCLNCGKTIIIYLATSGKFCSHECQQEYQYKEYINKWKSGEITGLNGNFYISNYIRRYLFEKHHNKCEKCGWSEINKHTGRIPLQIHHIDGNCTNNNEDNLQLLCPNCHSLTDNYCGANKKATPGRTKYFGRDNHKSLNN